VFWKLKIKQSTFSAVCLGCSSGLILFMVMLANVLPRSLRPEAEALLPAYAGVVGGIAVALLYLGFSNLIPAIKSKPKHILTRKGGVAYVDLEPEERKQRKGKASLALRILGFTCAGLLVGYVLLSLLLVNSLITLPQGLNFPCFIAVQGRSMEPTIHHGDAALVWMGGSWKVGDIVVYKHPKTGKLIIHRVIGEVEVDGKTYLKTKGDGNEKPDLWLTPPENVLGKYSGFSVPGLGSFLVIVASPPSLVLIAAVLAGLTAVYILWRRGEEEQSQVQQQKPTEEKPEDVEGSPCIFVEGWVCRIKAQTIPLEVCQTCINARLEWEKLKIKRSLVGKSREG